MTHCETFRWHHHVFDVTKINLDIDRGILAGESVAVHRATIEWYSERVLGVLEPSARLFPQLEAVDVGYSKSLVSPRADASVVFVQLPPLPLHSSDLSAGLDVPGVLLYDSVIQTILAPEPQQQPDIVLIDGNHRIASAYFGGRKVATGVLLRIDQLRAYTASD